MHGMVEVSYANLVWDLGLETGHWGLETGDWGLETGVLPLLFYCIVEASRCMIIVQSASSRRTIGLEGPLQPPSHTPSCGCNWFEGPPMELLSMHPAAALSRTLVHGGVLGTGYWVLYAAFIFVPTFLLPHTK